MLFVPAVFEQLKFYKYLYVEFYNKKNQCDISEANKSLSVTSNLFKAYFIYKLPCIKIKKLNKQEKYDHLHIKCVCSFTDEDLL